MRKSAPTGAHRRAASVLRELLASEAGGGIVLMVAATAALILANSPAADSYFGLRDNYVAGMSVLHWINDALMAVFFLLVGLEIKREFLDGQLATWRRRILPGIAAAGGMIVPALFYVSGGNSTSRHSVGTS
jgi:Na+:H+ antiporter, NhaA family